MRRSSDGSECFAGLAFVEIQRSQESLSRGGQQEFQAFERKPRTTQSQIAVFVLEVHIHGNTQAIVGGGPVIQFENASRRIPSVDVTFDRIGSQGLRSKRTFRDSSALQVKNQHGIRSCLSGFGIREVIEQRISRRTVQCCNRSIKNFRNMEASGSEYADSGMVVLPEPSIQFQSNFVAGIAVESPDSAAVGKENSRYSAAQNGGKRPIGAHRRQCFTEQK